MSALLRTKMFWSLALFVCLGVSLGQQSALAIPLSVTISDPGGFKTSDRPTLQVNVGGATGADTLTLSLLDSTGIPVTNGAVLTTGSTGNVDNVTANVSTTVAYNFATAHITTPGTYKLRAVLAGADNLTNTSAVAFTVSAGVPATVGITSGPTPASVTANNTFAVGVTVNDADGNPVANGIAVALTVSPTLTGASTAGLTSATAGGTGVAPFTAQIKTAGTYTITAATTTAPIVLSTANPIIARQTVSVVVSAGAPTTLSFTTQPASGSNIVAGTTIPVVVHLLDANSNPVPSVSIALALSGGSAGSSLSGSTTAVTDTSGNATFSNLSVNQIGSSYILTASSPGVTSVVGNSFNIIAADASQITFSAQPPSSTAAGVAFPTPASDVKVTVKDAYGNPISGRQVTLALLPSSGTLSGPNPTSLGSPTQTVATTTLGVAVFPSLSVSPAGTYQLNATAGVASNADANTITVNSNLFTITAGAATQLVFGQTPPASITSGTPFTVTVQAEDGAGSIDGTYSSFVTLQLVTPPTPVGATLGGGTVRVQAVHGIATFTNLRPDLVGSYAVKATDTPDGGSFTTAAPNPTFTVTPGPAATLSFTTQPAANANIPAGTIIPVVVHVVDAHTNPVIGVTVTVSPTTGSINGTNTVLTNSSGNATFSGLNITTAVNQVHLSASTSGVSPLLSNAFNITAGTGILTFTVQPTTTAAGQTITPAVVVTDADSHGNPVSGASIALALSTGTGTLLDNSVAPPVAQGPVLTDANGQATFSTLRIDPAGTKQLTASATGVPSILSNTFIITNGPGILSFTTEPAAANFQAGADLTPNTTVHFEDAVHNPISGASITLALTGTSTSGGTPTLSAAAPSATTEITNASGNATFSHLSVNLIGTYKLQASAPGLLPAPAPVTTANQFTITAGTGTLTFTVQPTTTAAGQTITPAVVVTDADSHGNPVSGASIALALSSGTGTLLDNSVAPPVAQGPVLTDANGQATFSTLRIDPAGTKQLTASATGVPSILSNTFAITAGGVNSLSFASPGQQPPHSVKATLPFSVVVHAEDASLNPAVGVSISLVLNGAPTAAGSTATLTPTSPTATTDSNGNATFSGLSVDKAGAAYTLTASTPDPANALAILTATSSTFTIAAGDPSTLNFSTEPPLNAPAGPPAQPGTPPGFTTVVTVTDAGGNLISNASVTLALNQAASGTALLTPASPTAPTDANGNATFSGLYVNRIGTYTLTASTPNPANTNQPLTAISSQFTITAGAPQLSFAVQPTNVASGSILPITVHLQDTSGNPIAGTGISLTLLLGTVTSSFTPTSTTTATTGSDGNAVFSNLSISPAATGYTIRASTPNPTAPSDPTQNITASSNPFTIAPGAPFAVTFTTSPSNAAPNAPITPAVRVKVADAAGNLVPNAAVTLSLTSTTGAIVPPGTLGGSLTGTTGDGSSTSSVLGVASFSSLAVSQPGTYQLTATAASATGKSSAFIVGNLPPTITGLTVTGLLDGTTGQNANGGPIHVGDTNVTVLITGTSFVSGSTVTFDGIPLTSSVSVNSATQITAALPDEPLASASTKSIIISNPDGLTAGKLLPSNIFNLPFLPLGPSKTANRTAHALDFNRNTQYFDPGLQLFSVPFDYSADAIKDVLGVFQLTPSSADSTADPLDLNLDGLFAFWNPAKPAYDLTTPDTKFVLGQGYWGRFRFLPPSATVTGLETGLKMHGAAAAVVNNLFPIALQAGWNMIGDPFIGSVSLSLIQVQELDAVSGKPTGQPLSLSQASDTGIVSDYLYKYVSGTPTVAGNYSLVVPSGLLQPNGSPVSGDNYLNPYIGYWVFAYQPCQLLVPKSLQILE